jgi:hypothetical protein
MQKRAVSEEKAGKGRPFHFDFKRTALRGVLARGLGPYLGRRAFGSVWLTFAR